MTKDNGGPAGPFDDEAIEAAAKALDDELGKQVATKAHSYIACIAVTKAAITAAWASLESRGMASVETRADPDMLGLIYRVAIVRLPEEPKP